MGAPPLKSLQREGTAMQPDKRTKLLTERVV
jgi:hypothetical protein